MTTANGRRGILSRAAGAAGVVLTGAVPDRLEKIGYNNAPQDRTKGSSPTPQPDLGLGEKRSKWTTYFTTVTAPGSQPDILYNGERLWAKVTITMETAGPVAVGDLAQITPVLSGRGQLLQTGKEREFIVAKGTRLYVASTSVNRLAISIEPLPWLEQIVGILGKMIGR